MSRQYKIAYEWQEGGHRRLQEVIVESDNELTTAIAAVTKAVKNAAAHSANQLQAAVIILSIVPCIPETMRKLHLYFCRRPFHFIIAAAVGLNER